MSALTITWHPGPEAIAAAILAKAAATRAGLESVAQTNAARGEGMMKQGAPWTDRTGNARQGLTGRADGLTIYLMHTVAYGHWLEDGTSKMAPRPIVRPTAQTLTAMYAADAVAFVQGMWG